MSPILYGLPPGARQPQAAKSGNGPALAKWAFTGREVESTDPNKGTVGVEAPCIYDPATRAVSFSGGA